MRKSSEDPPGETSAVALRGGTHIERWSPPLDPIGAADAMKLWGRLGKGIDGTAAAATTSHRGRTLVTKVFDDAVRARHLGLNPEMVFRSPSSHDRRTFRHHQGHTCTGTVSRNPRRSRSR